MLNKLNYVLDNENGFCNPQIIIQLPLFIAITNIVVYFAFFGADFYNNATGCLFK